ncbi:MAG: hypothetical protein U1D30_14835 [Planctomycetota bacterium]
MQRQWMMGVIVIGLISGTTGMSAETNILAKEGDRKLEKIAPLADNHSEKTYFEVQYANRAVGVGILSLKAHREQEKLVYEYEHDVRIKMPNGLVMILNIQATLTPKYRPLAIDVQRSVTLPDGQTFNGSQAVTVEQTRIVTVSNEGGIKNTREVPLPATDFIYGVDALIGHLDFKNQKKDFVFRHLDLESGQPTELHFHWTVNQSRKEQLNVSKDGGKTMDEFFLFEWSGEMVGYGKMEPPFVEVKSNESRYNEVKKLLDL